MICRGNRGAVVFASDDDVRLLLKTLGEARYSLPNQRIAELLHMGHPTIVSTCRGRVEASGALSRQYKALIAWIDNEKH